ncbi:MAG TPA: DUF5682 family protein [Trebonia sp.]
MTGAYDAERIHVLGIRHHGPGSARSAVGELDRIRPDILLIEGPADADPFLSLAADPGMTPPVALLAYDPASPKTSAFWPFAVFSPEWQALTWALRNQVPVRFCDLPASAMLAWTDDDDEAGTGGDGTVRSAERDPIAGLAAAAGYADPERWWDSVVESRADGASPFPALTEAMAALREDIPDPPRELRREAHMRQVLRAALKETSGTVAVVCGAWHAPALTAPLPPASRDAALLRGTRKRKAALAWVPWTHSRLAAASGYGAGITSPGWYHHLFTVREQVTERWLTRVAGVLRARDLPVSSAHVIEATRLASALATMRSRPVPGLEEVTEATRAVMCDGSDVVLAYVTRDLVVGELLGSVPEDAPPVPLDADLRAGARRLKLRIDPAEKILALDLRRDIDRARSEFLHGLLVLGIDWGSVTEDPVRATGTFRETWALRWRPELSVAIIDAAVWGTTVTSAATARIVDRAGSATSLSEVTGAVLSVLLASLDDALDPVLRALDARAAADADVVDLMTALPPLIRAVRYGNVRGTPVTALTAVADALVARICAGLPAAAGGLGDDAAARLRSAIDGTHAAMSLRAASSDGVAVRARWLEALTGLAGRRDLHGLLAGRVTRLLADAAVLPWPDAAVRFRAALSAGVPAPAKAAWAEGFLAGGGLLLVHDRDLLEVLDSWVASLGDEEFTGVLPLLRRTFGEYGAAERAGIGRALRGRLPDSGGPGSGGSGPCPGGPGKEEIDAERAAGAVATVRAILESTANLGGAA